MIYHLVGRLVIAAIGYDHLRMAQLYSVERFKIKQTYVQFYIKNLYYPYFVCTYVYTINRVMMTISLDQRFVTVTCNNIHTYFRQRNFTVL